MEQQSGNYTHNMEQNQDNYTNRNKDNRQTEYKKKDDFMIEVDLFEEILDSFFLISHSCFSKSNTQMPLSLKIPVKKYKVVVEMMSLPALLNLQDLIFRIITRYEERRVVKSMVDASSILDCILKIRTVDENILVRFLKTIDNTSFYNNTGKIVNNNPVKVVNNTINTSVNNNHVNSEELKNFVMGFLEKNPKLFIQLSHLINPFTMSGDVNDKLENFIVKYGNAMKIRTNEILNSIKTKLLNDERELEGILVNFGRFLFSAEERGDIKDRLEEYESRKLCFKKKRSSDLSRIIRSL